MLTSEIYNPLLNHWLPEFEFAIFHTLKVQMSHHSVEIGHATRLTWLLPKSDLEILLCLKPDNFTHQRETTWAVKG